MTITHTDIWKFSIPMHPFTIATGTMHFAQNIFTRLHTSAGWYGAGECSAFPMITGETQATCFEMAKEFAKAWKGKDPLNIDARLRELDDIAAFNTTIKSAFDMALHDIAAKNAGQPLFQYLGGHYKELETDITVGISSPEEMAVKAAAFVGQGFRIIKVKLGKKVEEDIERIKRIRHAVSENTVLRIDANQGWTYDDAIEALLSMSTCNIEFCEQPMRAWDDHHLPNLKKISPIPIMADESVYDHRDADRLIKANACDSVNIKFAKSGGIREAIRIHDTCKKFNVPCMMGGMLESRIAQSAFAHFSLAHDNVKYFDMDTPMLGHKVDPVKGGVHYSGYRIATPLDPGIGADADDSFLKTCEFVTI